MNSIYCYCDVVLFVEARLPDLDKTIHTCELVPSQHKWLHFIDTIQYIKGVDRATTIQKNDIVVKLQNHKKEDLTLQLLIRPIARSTTRWSSLSSTAIRSPTGELLKRAIDSRPQTKRLRPLRLREKA